MHADNIELNSSNDTVIRGANVDARDTLELNVGNDLLVQSQQNRYNASNNSLGLSAGISMGADHNSGQVNSVNGGVNTSNGRTRVRETVLTTVTGETVDINVGNNTAIVGATIAATDAEGNDNGQLSLDTQSLEFVDLNNTAHSSQQSAGISTNINLNGSGQSSSAQTQMAQSVGGGLSSSSSGQDPGTTRLSYSNNSSNSRANTLATVGEGDITVRDDAESGEDSTERLNRDIDSTERDIYDVDQPAIDLELEVENQVIVDAVQYVGEAAQVAYTELRVITTNLPEDLKDLGPMMEEHLDEVIRNNANTTEFLNLVAQEGYQDFALNLLSIRDSVNNGGIEVFTPVVNGAAPVQDGQYDTESGVQTVNFVDTTFAMDFMDNMREAKAFVDSLPAEEAAMAMMSIELIAGGPARTLLQYGAEYVVNTATEGIQQGIRNNATNIIGAAVHQTTPETFAQGSTANGGVTDPDQVAYYNDLQNTREGAEFTAEIVLGSIVGTGVSSAIRGPNRGSGNDTENLGESDGGVGSPEGNVSSTTKPNHSQGEADDFYNGVESSSTGVHYPNSTGTVWDNVTPTQGTYPNSQIPRSFEIKTDSGTTVWVHGNATEHLAEYASNVAKNYPPNVVNLRTQEQIRSMQSAIEQATKNGVEYNKLINVGGWELKFSPPRTDGQLPALIHALPTE